MNNPISSRQSNIELLRIVSMLMIIGHHLAHHGIMHIAGEEQFQSWSKAPLINRLFVSFLYPGGEVGVAIFFIITGYFCIEKKKADITKVALQTSFYGLMMFVLYVVTFLLGYKFDGLGFLSAVKYSIRNILLPSTGGGYWFVAAYAAVILLIPIVNPILNGINKRSNIVLIAVFWLFLYSLSSILDIPFFIVQKGMFYYLIGAYIKLHEMKTNKLKCVLLFLLGWLIGTFSSFGTAVFEMQQNQNSKYQLLSMGLQELLTCVAVPICAIELFNIFRKASVKSSKIIYLIASTVFGVYLIHDSVFGRSLIWNGIFKVSRAFCSEWFPLLAVACVLIVMASCSVIDLLRLKMIEPVMLKKASKTLEMIRSKAKSEYE